MDLINLVMVEQLSRQILLLILNTSLKGLLIFSCIYLILLCSKRISTQTRHLLWFLSIAGFVILPVLSFLLPPIQIGLNQLQENPSAVYQTITSAVSLDLSSVSEVRVMEPGLYQEYYGSDSINTTYRWTFSLIVWVAGSLIAFSRSCYGSIKARKILRESKPVQWKELVTPSGNSVINGYVNRSVRLYSSSQISSPFTIRIFRPVIVIPTHMISWSFSDIEPVILHEMNHIKRKDYLTQTTSIFICSLFWFIPVVWIAFKKLYEAQENACDEEVVRNGIHPRHYVKQMFKIVCSMASTNVSPGLFMINGRKKMFEKRIINILEKRGTIMKKGNLIFVGFVFMLVLSVIAGCVTANRAISADDFLQAWSGTWVNTDNPGNSWIPQKIVANTDSTYDIYPQAIASVRFCHHSIALTDQWTDAKGNIWYKADGYCHQSGIEGAMYGKISNSGNTLEFVYNMTKEPIEKWEPNNSSLYYCKFYREQ